MFSVSPLARDSRRGVKGIMRDIRFGRNTSGVRTHGVVGKLASPKRGSKSASVIGSIRSTQRHDQASKPSSAGAETPASRKLASRVSPCRLAKRLPSGPMTSGTCVKLGGVNPRAR